MGYLIKRRIKYYMIGEFYLGKEGNLVKREDAKVFKTEEEAKKFLYSKANATFSDYWIKRA